MRLWMALLGVLPACGFGGGDATDAGPGGEAAVEVDASFCYGTFERVCFPAAPTEAVVIATTEAIDTATSARCNPTASLAEHYCVIAGASFTIATTATLRAYGSKPLILISTTTMFNLAGVVDVSSGVIDPNIGAGASTAECAAGTAATQNSGGFGGSFGGKGGGGKMIDGVSGVAPSKLPTPSQLRAGCAGGPGAGTTGGTGGAGGGAVAIIAPAIQIAGHIDASGAGGRGGGPKKCGGGGGGSGGMVVLDAPTVAGAGPVAMVYANGGGGGQGGEDKALGDGANGQDPAGPSQAALGGKNGTTNSSPTTGGGGGADGATGTSLKDGEDAAGGANGMGGGGGGGGAAGVVRAASATNVTIAPAPDPL